ncbi:MAG: hypothetical protein MHM6MM_009247, partial [Cercozoa sp. M6MM]
KWNLSRGDSVLHCSSSVSSVQAPSQEADLVRVEALRHPCAAWEESKLHAMARTLDAAVAFRITPCTACKEQSQWDVRSSHFDCPLLYVAFCGCALCPKCARERWRPKPEMCPCCENDMEFNTIVPARVLLTHKVVRDEAAEYRAHLIENQQELHRLFKLRQQELRGGELLGALAQIRAFENRIMTDTDKAHEMRYLRRLLRFPHRRIPLKRVFHLQDDKEKALEAKEIHKDIAVAYRKKDRMRASQYGTWLDQSVSGLSASQRRHFLDQFRLQHGHAYLPSAKLNAVLNIVMRHKQGTDKKLRRPHKVCVFTSTVCV